MKSKPKKRYRGFLRLAESQPRTKSLPAAQASHPALYILNPKSSISSRRASCISAHSALNSSCIFASNTAAALCRQFGRPCAFVFDFPERLFALSHLVFLLLGTLQLPCSLIATSFKLLASSRIYSYSIPGLSNIYYPKSIGHLSQINPTSIQRLSNIYPQYGPKRSKIYLTSSQHPSKIYLVAIKIVF